MVFLIGFADRPPVAAVCVCVCVFFGLCVCVLCVCGLCVLCVCVCVYVCEYYQDFINAGGADCLIKVATVSSGSVTD